MIALRVNSDQNSAKNKLMAVGEHKSTPQLFIAIVLIIFFIEFGIMLIVHFIMPHMSPLTTGSFDSFLLITTLFPVLYLLFFRPMQKLIAELKDALSEVKLFEIERDNFIAELESKNKELDAFSYSVSHDLRSPLQTIKDLTEKLTERHRENFNAEEINHADNINLTIDHMDRFIDDLLAYARLGHKSLKLRGMPLGFVIAQVTDVLSPRIEKTGAAITIADDLPDISGDQILLQQIFSNLLDNALTYCQEKRKPEISISWQQDKNQAIICVADNGIGIPAEQQERIFEMFHRLHSQDEYPGTGIGLAIVKKAVEMQGGRIWIESEVTRGSKFYISFLLPD